jgi:single-stranded-DNA-specific exonuclease
VGFDVTGLGKGSARSIEGLSLVEALGRCHLQLEKFGGHEMAAGLTIQQKAFPDFVSTFGAAARELLSPECLKPRLRLDYELMFSDFDDELLRWYQALEPFGMGNRAPLFLVRTVEPVVPPQILKEKHLALRLRQNRHVRRAIFFDGLSSPLPAAPWDMAVRISPNVFGGQTRLEIQVEALRQSRPTV